MSPPITDVADGPAARCRPADWSEFAMMAARLLFTSGQTTERTMEAVARLAKAQGCHATLFPRWDEMTIRFDCAGGPRYDTIATAPKGVDMHRVAATMDLVDQVCNHRVDVQAARSSLDEIAALRPVSTLRFTLLAAAGATALAVIFGSVHLVSLSLIGLSAGAGAVLRRWIGGITDNPLVPPFLASLLAGVLGAIAARLNLSPEPSLLDACPCMILVPGPHILNAAIDLARARVALGAARMIYAGLIILMICTGLLVGLSLGGTALPASTPSHTVPLGYDIVAAGVAVMAYGIFFSMPWRMLPVPIIIGMLAHASRWVMIFVAGASVESGALVACLLAGTLATLAADRLRLPFAALGFASVVSLIPGVFLFRMAGGLVSLAAADAHASSELLLGVIADATTSILIILAMAFGLILPKMCVEQCHRKATSAGPRPTPRTRRD